jgi:hypothetical protein
MGHPARPDRSMAKDYAFSEEHLKSEPGVPFLESPKFSIYVDGLYHGYAMKEPIELSGRITKHYVACEGTEHCLLTKREAILSGLRLRFSIQLSE